jgi:hypothetical protein
MAWPPTTIGKSTTLTGEVLTELTATRRYVVHDLVGQRARLERPRALLRGEVVGIPNDNGHGTVEKRAGSPTTTTTAPWRSGRDPQRQRPLSPRTLATAPWGSGRDPHEPWPLHPGQVLGILMDPAHYTLGKWSGSSWTPPIAPWGSGRDPHGLWPVHPGQVVGILMDPAHCTLRKWSGSSWTVATAPWASGRDTAWHRPWSYGEAPGVPSGSDRFPSWKRAGDRSTWHGVARRCAPGATPWHDGAARTVQRVPTVRSASAVNDVPPTGILLRRAPSKRCSTAAHACAPSFFFIMTNGADPRAVASR